MSNTARTLTLAEVKEGMTNVATIMSEISSSLRAGGVTEERLRIKSAQMYQLADRLNTMVKLMPGSPNEASDAEYRRVAESLNRITSKPLMGTTRR